MTLWIKALRLRRRLANQMKIDDGLTVNFQQLKQVMKKSTLGKLLVVEGNIAAGKSTLSKRLGECFDYKVNGTWHFALIKRGHFHFGYTIHNSIEFFSSV